MRKLITVIFVLFSWASVVLAQNATVKVADIENAVAGDSIVIPVTAVDLNDVGVVTININYDQGVLTGGRIINVNSAFDAPTVNVADGQISFSYFGFVGLNIGTDKLFDVKMKYVGTPGDGKSDLVFDGSTQITDPIGTPINVDFQDGSVSPFPVLLTAPNGGEVWQSGTVQNITWETYQIDNIKIEYSTDNGTQWNEIIASTSSDVGTYAWTVPNTPTAQALVRITDVLNAGSTDQSNAVFSITEQPEINLTSPNGGETWVTGTQHSITWSSAGITNVKIEYRINDSDPWREVAASAAAAGGSYTWTIPSTPSTEAKVRVSDADNAAVTDISENYFTITDPYVTVLSPNGGETWAAGSAHDIKWTSLGIENVKIEYKHAGLADWTVISNSTSAATGSYSWTVPAEQATDAKVRITDVDNAAYSDESDAAFSITFVELTIGNLQNITPGTEVTVPVDIKKLYEAGAITLKIDYDETNVNFSEATNINSQISGAQINAADGFINISWNSLTGATIEDARLLDLKFTYNGTPNDGKSDLTFVNGSNEISDLVGNPLSATYNDGSITPYQLLLTAPDGGEVWQVGQSYDIEWESFESPNNALYYSTDNGQSWILIEELGGPRNSSYGWTVPNTPTSQALVKVVDTDNNTISDQSDAAFTIAEEATISVTAPNGGENWIVGDQENITWSSVSVTNVKLEYSINNGTDWIEIIASTPAAAGSYTWTLPDNPSAQAQVKVTSVEDGTVSDQSDAVFNILAPSITVTSPNGGETWVTNSTHDITWNSVGVENVKIEYDPGNAVGGGREWMVVTASAPAAAGTYSWQLPPFVTTQGRLRITAVEDGTISDVSDAFFDVVNIELTIGNDENVKPGDEIIIPVDGKYLFDIGSMTLKIDYDETEMTFVEAINVNNNINTALINSDGNVVTLSWQNIAGTTIADAKLFDMKFQYTAGPSGGGSDLEFIEAETEITDINANILGLTSNNGQVTPFPVLLTAPNGGEVWQAGSEHNITWESYNIGTVLIEYSTNNGGNWSTVQTDVAGNSYAWTIPATTTSQALVRVTDSDNAGVSDQSDAVFNIADQPTLTLTAPNGGENWLVGAQENITWSSVDVIDVKLEYSINNGADWIEIIASASAAAGSYLWTIPDAPTAQALIRATSVENGAVTDQSDAVFNIIQPSITVLSPNGGELWIGGSAHNITWNSVGVGNVKIEFSPDGSGGTFTTVNESVTASTGSYEWILPQNETTNGVIKISSVEDNTINDLSDNVFSIEKVKITIEPLQDVKPNEIIELPVNAVNLLETGSITLKIDYDETVMTFSEAVNVDPRFSNALITDNNGQINVSWFSLQGATVADGKLFDLEFTYNGTPASGQTDLTFISGENEIADIAGNPLASVYNDGYVKPYPLLLVVPNGGELWQIGADELITWQSYEVNNAKLEYSTDNGNNWLEIIASTPAAGGSYSWNIPDAPTSQALVRIKNFDQQEYFDASDDVFTIAAEQTLQLTTPNGGEEWLVGSQQAITWQSANVENIKLEYRPSSGVAWITIENSIPAINGTYNWTIPDDPTTTAEVQITSVENPGLADNSDNVFSILAPFVTVTQPNGGENWEVGQEYDITWNSIGVENVKLAYRINDLSPWFEITQSVPASDGSFTWMVPDVPTTEAKIQITSTAASEITDITDGYFTISAPQELSISASDIQGTPGENVIVPFNVTAFNEIGAITLEIEYNSDMLSFVGAQNINDEVQGVIFNQSPEGNSVSVSWFDNVAPFDGANIGDGKIFDLEFAYNGGAADITFNENQSEIADLLGSPLDVVYNNGSVNSSVNQYIALLLPNGGENWEVGSEQTVKWLSGGLNDINIYLRTSENGAWDLLTTVASATGEYTFEIPNEPTEEARIKVESVDNQTISDISDNVFTILSNLSLVVMQPNGGENWIVGTQEEIKWQSTGFENVKIEYRTSIGGQWIEIIASHPAASGTYLWTIPDAPTDEATIKVSDAANPEYIDISDFPFTISQPLPLSMTIGSVQGIPAQNVTIPVEATSFNEIGAITLRIEYDPQLLEFVNYSNLNPEISATIINNNQEEGVLLASWFDSAPPYNGANIGDGKLFDMEFTYNGGNAAVVFNTDETELSDLIGNPLQTSLIDGGVTSSVGEYITIIKPNGGEEFTAGEIAEIMWVTQGVATFDIEYSTDNGGNWNYIEQNFAPVDMTYQWAVPNTPTENAIIRVSSSTQPAINDKSDNVFTINEPDPLSIIAGEISGVPGTEVVVPFTSVSFFDIGAVTLRIEYDPAVLSFITSEEVNPELDGAIFNESPDGEAVLVSWFDNVPPYDGANIGNGTLFNLKFNYIGGSTDLLFNESESEIADLLGTPLNVVYDNGSVSSSQGEYVVLTSPNGGESWQSGSLHDIKWLSGGVNNVKLEYTVNNGGQWTEIAQNIAAADEVFSWLVPNEVSNEAKVRITSMENGNIADESDAVFSILPSGPITLTLADVTGVPGQPVIASLDVSGFVEIGAITLRIEYNPDMLDFIQAINVDPEVQAIIVNEAADGDAVLVSWFDNVPPYDGANIGEGKMLDLEFTYNGGNTGLDFNLDVSELADVMGNPVAAAYNNGSVSSGVGEYLVLTRPNGGEEFAGNTLEQISWLSEGVNNIKIEYTDGAGRNTFVIANSVPAAGGSFEWLVPNAPSNNAKVIITSLDNSQITDESDNPFTILQAGTLTLTLPDLVLNPGDNAVLPLTAENFAGVGAVTLKIKYNPSILEFTSVSDIHSELTSAIINQEDDAILVSWFDSEPPYNGGNIGDDKLFDLNFNYQGGEVSVVFDEETSEIADINGEPVTVNYNNGSVTSAVDKYIVVEMPNGGEIWDAGFVKEIQWQSSLINNVKIEYRTGENNSWIPIVENVPAADGSFNWTIPNTPTDQARVRISDAEGSGTEDISNAVFTINPAGDLKLIAGEVVGDPNTEIVVPFNAENFLDIGAVTLRIEYDSLLLGFTGVEWVNDEIGTAIFNEAPDGGAVLVSWFDNIPPYDGANIGTAGIFNLKFNYKGGYTDVTFNEQASELANSQGDPVQVAYAPGSVSTTSDKYLFVTRPDGGETFAGDTFEKIEWTSEGIDNVKIEYSTDNGTEWNLISTSTPAANGEFLWQVANVNTNEALVKVTSWGADPISDVSDGTFNIVYVNAAPQFVTVIGDTTINEGEAFEFRYEGFDFNAHPLSFALVSQPVGNMQLSPEGLFTWTPGFEAAGEYEIIVSLFDNVNRATVYDTSKINVTDVNQPPYFVKVIGDTTINENQAYSFKYLGTDPDLNPVVFALVSAPVGNMQFTTQGRLTWTPTFEEAGDYDIIVSLSDNISREVVYDTSTIHVLDVNRAPYFTAVIGEETINENQAYQFQYTGDDPDNHPLTFALASQAVGNMAITGDGLFSWTPSFEEAGDYDVIVSLTDNVTRATVYDTSTVHVLDVNRAPYFTAVIGEETINENQYYEFQYTGDDPDNHPLTFALASQAAGDMAITGAGLFTWTPTFEEAGDYEVIISLTDNVTRATVYDTSTIHVLDINREPYFTAVIGEETINENQYYEFQYAGDDPDNHPLTFALASQAAGDMAITGAGLFTWTPTFEEAGNYEVIISLTDNVTRATVYDTSTIHVLDINRAPYFTAVIGEETINENQYYEFQYTGDDPDNHPLTFALGSQAVGDMAITGAGLFTWTPTFEEAGNYEVIISLTDNVTRATVYDTSTIHVLDVNREPYFTAVIGEETINENQYYEFQYTGDDPDNHPLTFALGSQAAGDMAITGAGLFTWTPTFEEAGNYEVIISLTDNVTRATVYDTSTIHVLDVNREPYFTAVIGEETINENQYYEFQYTGDDPDNHPLTFALASQAVGDMAITGAGLFTWTPTFEEAGDYEVIVSLTDNVTRATVYDTSTVHVLDVNREPYFTAVIGEETINENQYYEFQYTGDDPDNHPLTFSLASQPAGDMAITGAGLFTWTPTFEEAGDYEVIVSLTDNVTRATVYDTSTVHVLDVNREPYFTAVIGEETINANQYFEFQYTGDDPDNHPLTFALASQAVGDMAITGEGLFTWTPTFEEAGDYEVIVSLTDNVTRATVYDTSTIHVLDVNHAPYFTAVIGEETINENQYFEFQYTGDDPDNNPLTFSLASQAVGDMAITGDGLFTWTPSFDEAGDYEVIVSLTDNVTRATVYDTSTVHVLNVNREPYFTSVIGDTTIIETEAFEFQYDGEDPDNNPLTFTLVSNPVGNMQITQDGLFTWTPTTEMAGDYEVIVAMNDAATRAVVYDTSNIHVLDSNQPPYFTAVIGEETINENNYFEFQYTGEDPNSDPVTFSLISNPVGDMMIANEGLFTWTPDYTMAGDYDVIVALSDNVTRDVVYDTSVIHVSNVNLMPYFTSVLPDTTIKEHFSLSYQYQGEDPDNGDLTFSLVTQPVGNMQLTTGGLFTWTPTFTSAGEYEIIVALSDNTTRAVIYDTAMVTVTDVDVTVLNPQGNNVIPAATTFEIWWEAINLDMVKIEYRTSPGEDWILIADSVDADNNITSAPETIVTGNVKAAPKGADPESAGVVSVDQKGRTNAPTGGGGREISGIYQWVVPNTPSTTCRVRISDIDDPANYDLSNSDFTITDPLPMTMSTNDIFAAPGDSVDIPINVVNFNNVASMHIIMKFDEAVLDWGRVVAINPNLITAQVSINDGSITIDWSNPEGVTIPDGNIAMLRVEYDSGITDLDFDENNNFIRDPEGFDYTVNYIDGSVKLVAPEPPELVYPVNGQSDLPVSVTLNWGDVYGAVSYNAQVATDYQMTNIIVDTVITTSEVEIRGLAYKTPYYWRVSATNITGTSAWSEKWLFKTEWYVEFANVQPGHINLPVGEAASFRGQVYVPNLTNGPGQGEGVVAWIGISSENNNPDQWADSLWTQCYYLQDVGSRDEFAASLGASLEMGTYFYAMRYQIDEGSYWFGGWSESGGGFWNGTTNKSGSLYVTWQPIIKPTQLRAQAQEIGKVFLSWIDNAENETGYTVERKLGDTTIAGQYEEIASLEANSQTYLDTTVSTDSLKYTYRVQAFNADTVSDYSNLAIVAVLTKIEVVDLIPDEYSLSQNYPNPFNPSTRVKYGIPSESRVRIVIYNSLGEVVTTAVNEIQKAGTYILEWDAGRLASGVYIYSLYAEELDGEGNFSSIKKMILLK